MIETYPTNNIDLLGRGLYTLPEASHILQVPKNTLRRWAQGYTFETSSGSRSISESLIDRELDGINAHILTFQDLIELKFVALLRDAGVSMRVIRAAGNNAREMYGSQRPFATHKFETDGTRLFHTIDPSSVSGVSRDRVITEIALSQMVIEVAARPYFVKIEYDEEARRLWPLGKGRTVVLDPERSFGAPIDVKSGTPTLTLFKMATSGESVDRIAWWYSVSEQAVKDAIEFEATLMAA
jgi:uncharacterized protein (DUF433 family)